MGDGGDGGEENQRALGSGRRCWRIAAREREQGRVGEMEAGGGGGCSREGLAG